MVSFIYLDLYLRLLVKDGGSSTVDKFLVSIVIILGIIFVLYCFYVRFLPSLRRFLYTTKLEGQRLMEEDPKPSKLRRIFNKLLTMIWRDSLEQPHLPIQSIETEVELKSADPAQSEYKINIEHHKEAQKRSLSLPRSGIENGVRGRRISYNIPDSITRTERSADDLNLLFRSRMWSRASGSANHIQQGSANNLNRLPRWTDITNKANNDSITVTSDRGIHHDLLLLDTETSKIVEKGRRIKRRSLTSIPSQSLDVEDQTNTLKKPRGRHSSKNAQAIKIFRRSDFEDNRFKKIDEIEIHENIPDDTIYRANSESHDDEMSNKDKILTLDNIIKEYDVGSVSE